jgi:cobalamin-dependent methionine synthase I
MKIDGHDREFIIVGENIHTTRVVSRKGKLVVNDPNGAEAVRFFNTDGERCFLVIDEANKKTQDYDEGRIKHIKVAVHAGMSNQQPQAEIALQYIHRQIQRQADANTDFLDLNVDEVSLKPAEQEAAMQWLVRTVQGMSDIPLSIDSSKHETLQAGFEAIDPSKSKSRPLLNSASLERIDALDVAKQHNAKVIVTAAGESGMPQNAEQRVTNASSMVETALGKDFALNDIYVDPLIFPIAVDAEFGNHCFDAIRQLAARFGPQIHITGGFSNVSFGLPCRRLINDVFLLLAVEADADSAIMDPATSNLNEVFALDRETRPFKLARDMLLGHDQYCKTFLRAYRKGELNE